MIATSANGDNMAIPLFIGIDADKPAIYVHSPMPYKVSADNVDKIACAVCEANFSMLIGSFDLDTRNNRIVFKSTLPFMESLISEATCKYMILLACYMADRFNLKFLELDKGDITLEQFIEYVQKINRNTINGATFCAVFWGSVSNVGAQENYRTVK